MDGSYGNVFGGPPPMSPDTSASSSEQYKVNVSRQKTRKWAEFKPQNYDGDDWGDDYDDGSEGPPPPPPPSSLKPMGPRQASTPPSASRQFAPGGPPSLHLQTQRAVSTPTGPVSAGGALEKPDLGHHVSPQSAMPHSTTATVSSMHSGGTPPASAHPGTLPPQRARSPAAPLSAGPIPTRFPPRKSSLGPQDAPVPPIGSAPQSRSSSRPGSSRGAPWNEQRPSSPANGRSSLTSPTKVQAFTRPADIYRRMEEEKQKERERRSMESAGRPSLDGAASPSPIPAKNQVELPELTQRPEEGADVARGLRPSLPPVAERKSEYGLDVLIASYGSDETEHPSSEQSKPAPLPLPSQSSSSQAPPAVAVNMRRYSSSPKLPELGRMSGFGEDLFSMSSGFTSNTASLPPLPDTPAQAEATAQQPSPAVQADASMRPMQATAETPSSPPSNHVGQTGIRPSSPQQQSPVAETPSPVVVVSPAGDTQFARPPLPGGWVSETPASPGPSSALIDEAVKSSTTSRMAEPDHSSQPDEGVTAKQQPSTTSRQDSPPAPPPFRTATPEPSTLSTRAMTEVGPKNGDAEVENPKSPVQTPATTREPEITPTAPLNPSRNSQKIELATDNVAPPPPPAIDTSSTLDTTSSSPVKESDLLREEIMKSLSPLNPPNDYLAATGTTATAGTASISAYHAAAGSPLRESTYLGDVYGDYWESTEDKSTPVPINSEGKIEQKSLVPEQLSPVPQDAKLQSAVPAGETQISAAEPETEKKSGDLRRRFSWETGAEPEVSNTSSSPPRTGETSPSDQKRPDPDPGATTSPASTGPVLVPPSSPPTLSIPTEEATAATPSQASAVSISHQVSKASTVLPGSKMDVPIEPPSPISVRSEGVRPSVEARRLSAAEDKVLVQTSTRDVSPPPLEEHPALVSESLPKPPSPAEPSSPVKTDAVNVVGFRQIMELPSSAERARLFNETRLQFASMDTGLNEWISNMIQTYPEHASASWSFRATLVGPVTASDGQQGGPMASQANLQAPYAQQQSTASTVGLGRPAANIPMPPTPPHGSSAFGHSGAHVQVAQVGTKSKKLLMAAGKAGKGLLSKGKNKLSGGDKVFFNS